MSRQSEGRARHIFCVGGSAGSHQASAGTILDSWPEKPASRQPRNEQRDTRAVCAPRRKTTTTNPKSCRSTICYFRQKHQGDTVLQQHARGGRERRRQRRRRNDKTHTTHAARHGQPHRTPPAQPTPAAATKLKHGEENTTRNELPKARRHGPRTHTTLTNPPTCG